MNNLSIPTILRSVEVLYDPTQTGDEKAVASTILTQLSESPDYAIIAMEILNSSDPSISFNSRFYSLNLLIDMFNRDWSSIPSIKQSNIIDFLDNYLISNVPMDIQRSITLGSKFSHLFATGMTSCWPSQWKTCIDTINHCISVSDSHLLVVVQILYYFASNLSGNQEEFNSVNGRKKRIKSFLPHVQSLILHSLSAIASFPHSPYLISICSTFIQFIVSIIKFIPENMLIACLPSIHSFLFPLIQEPLLFGDCMQFIAALAEHSFGKEHRSTIKSVFDLIVGLEGAVQQHSGSSDYFAFSQQYISILASFLRVQLKVFFPLRNEEDVELYRVLLDKVLRGLSFPSIRSELLLLYALPCLFQNEDIHPLPQLLELQEKSIQLFTQALYSCYITHVVSSPSFAAISKLEYDSAASYNHAFSELKKGIRESMVPLVKVNAESAVYQLLALLSSDVMGDRYAASAIVCITKGCVEGIHQQKIVSTNPELMKRLFLQLQDLLMRNGTSTPIPLLQTLSLLLPMISLSYEECMQVLQPLFIVLSSPVPDQDTVLESEVAKYLRTLVESQLVQTTRGQVFTQIGKDFQMLCLQNGITDATRSNILSAYVQLVVSTQDSSFVLSEITALISSFLSIIRNHEVQILWESPQAFKSYFSNNLNALSNITTAFNAVADIASFIPDTSMRFSLSSTLMSMLSGTMLTLTQVVLSVATTVHPQELEHGVVWIAYTQKELTNQHASLQFHPSEKLYSLYKSLMRCWKELLLNEANHSEELLGILTNILQSFYMKIRASYFAEWIQSISIPYGFFLLFIRVYLSSPLPPSNPTLHHFMKNTLSFIHFALNQKSYTGLMPYRLLNEVNDIIIHNTMASFYTSITTFFFYLIGHTMRGMALSLVNRPFLQTEAVDETKRDTQAVIEQRTELMKSRFDAVILSQTDSLDVLLECISLILTSPYQQAIQSIIAFLLLLLPCCSGFSFLRFLQFLVPQLLRLYLTTQSDRCKDITQCCLMAFRYIQTVEGTPLLCEGSSLKYIVMVMEPILQIKGDELYSIIVQILALADEKEQTMRFRKILEETKKRLTEKGVPLHL